MRIPRAGRRAGSAAVALDMEEGAGPRVRLGDWLRSERLRRGFSYEEIAQDTRINRLYLEALEEEHFDVIPAPVYTRGFVRSYAKALGLDPEAAIALLPDTLPRPPGLEPMPALRRQAHEAPAVAMPSLPSFRGPNMPSGMRLRMRMPRVDMPSVSVPSVSMPHIPLPSMQWLLAGAGAIVLVLAAIYLPRLLPDRTASNTTSTSSARATVEAAQPPATGAGKMPALVGTQLDAAKQTLSDLGVTWVTVEMPNEAPAGTVIFQAPKPGDGLKHGDNITLTVSRGAASR